jgi:hypothetical protein
MKESKMLDFSLTIASTSMDKEGFGNLSIPLSRTKKKLDTMLNFQD